MKFLMTRLMRLSRADFDFVIERSLRERGSALENRAKSYFGGLWRRRNAAPSVGSDMGPLPITS